MGVVFHGLLISGLLLLMTIFFAGYPVCNPILVYVVYLGLDADLVPGLGLALVAGLLLDGLSGTPVGVFLFTFLWVFCMVRWLGGVLRTTSPLFPLLAVLAGLVLENFFTFLVLAFGSHGQETWFMGIRFLLSQMATALFFCPLLLFFFRRLHLIFVRKKGPGRSDRSHFPSVSLSVRR